jgi:mono/diheme cytochrome c family protein
MAFMKTGWVLGTVWMLMTAVTSGAEEGKELYEAACASCHGVDGRGAPEGTAIEVPLPDFTDCSFVTRETTGNWVALAAHGGRELNLSPQMPGFGDALSEAQLRAIIDYVRGFCSDPTWPSGDLNFRRPLFTGKAFPEDEVVLNYQFEQSRRARSLVNEWILEKRVGARGMVEGSLPFVYNDPQDRATTGGVGDLTLAYKYVLLATQQYGAVAAFSLDLVLPTGDRDRGLGDGTVGFGPSLRAGKTLGPFVLQSEIKAVLPLDVNRAPRRLLYRAALQLPFSPLKRAWVPGLEFEADTRVEGQTRDAYYLAPVLYKGLSQRGHVAMAIGAKIPVAGARAFDYQIGAFLLWEYMDGGLWW